MNIKITMFSQPIGKFALGKMNADSIIKIMTTDARKYDPLTFEASGGVQRELSDKRLNEIAKYASTEDACFPTAIILSLPIDENNEEQFWELKDDEQLEIFDQYTNFALLVDGQHRMYGLKRAGQEIYSKFQIPVVFLFGATLEQQAKIFSIINSKQTQVSYSLVSQLFGVIEKRTFEKVAHDIASALNKREDSPYYQKIKMLGTKSRLLSTETLSQGTIVRQLIPLLKNSGTNNIFNELYEDKDDAFTLKVLLNYFNAAKDVWSAEWECNGSIITKTVGFIGLIKALPCIFKTIDCKDKKFSKDKFKMIFEEVNRSLASNNLDLTSDSFPSSGAGANKLKKIIEEAAQSIL